MVRWLTYVPWRNVLLTKHRIFRVFLLDIKQWKWVSHVSDPESVMLCTRMSQSCLEQLISSPKFDICSIVGSPSIHAKVPDRNTQFYHYHCPRIVRRSFDLSMILSMHVWLVKIRFKLTNKEEIFSKVAIVFYLPNTNNSLQKLVTTKKKAARLVHQ